MSRYLAIVGAIILAGLAGYLLWPALGTLSPRTPHAVARALSGLPVPDNAVVVRFEEEWTGMGGDGHVFVELAVEPSTYSELRRTALELNYSEWNDIQPLASLVTGCLRRGMQGLYVFQQQHAGGTWRIVVLDDTMHRVIACTVVT